MREPVLVLGQYRFDIDSAKPTSLSRQDSWRYQSYSPVGKDPIYQFMGPGESTLSIPGVIYPHHSGGLEQMDLIRTEADKGEAFQLINGYGENMGKWAITAVQEDKERLLGAMPKKIQFTISLIRVERP